MFEILRSAGFSIPDILGGGGGGGAIGAAKESSNDAFVGESGREDAEVEEGAPLEGGDGGLSSRSVTIRPPRLLVFSTSRARTIPCSDLPSP